MKTRNKQFLFGPKLRAYLEKIDMTQLDLSCRTSLTRANLSMIVQGKKNPSFDSLMKILKALNTNLETIMGET